MASRLPPQRFTKYAMNNMRARVRVESSQSATYDTSSPLRDYPTTLMSHRVADVSPECVGRNKLISGGFCSIHTRQGE
jgi:hypothetical protein